MTITTATVWLIALGIFCGAWDILAVLDIVEGNIKREAGWREIDKS